MGDYETIILGNQIDQGWLKDRELIGYYYNEDYNIFLEFTPNKEMVIYDKVGKEKGRVALRIGGKEDDSQRITINPLDDKRFSIDLSKGKLSNNEVFLEANAYFRKGGDNDTSLLVLQDQELELAKLTRKEFQNQLRTTKENIELFKKPFLTEEEAILFTKWYIGYQGQEIPSHIEVDHEEEKTYVVYAYDALEDKKENSTYLIDKQSGEVIPVGESLFAEEVGSKASMAYKVEDEMLWMIDEQDSKGRLLNLTTLYKDMESQFDNSISKGRYLGQLGENIYFTITQHEFMDKEYGFYVDAIYRYNLLERKATFLLEESGALNSPIDIHFEQERGTITVENLEARAYIKCQRIDALTGEVLEYIEPHCGRNGNYYFAKEEGLIYEVISPKEKRGFFISEYNEQTKQQRLICKISGSDYYDGKKVAPPVKEGDLIYFMDYDYYLTPEEEKVSRKGNPVYCQVNVKTGQVSRVSPEAMKEYFKDKEELCFWSLQD